MCFVKYKEIDLVYSNERMQQAVVQYLCSEDYGHIVLEMLVPD